MDVYSFSYFVFGLCLVALFGIITKHYYSRDRHEQGEEIKYKMLEDDE
jgi:hypothetical protein